MLSSADLDSAREIITSMRGRRVVVLGDVMLDEYLLGETSRVSPEAPIPVVEIRGHELRPGGAANAAANVVGLGGQTLLVGVVGDDLERGHLRNAALALGVDTDALVTVPGYRTTSKTRVLARNQQIVRFDREVRVEIDQACEKALRDRVDEGLRAGDALVISDYGKGVVTPSLMESVIAIAKRVGAPVIVDPKGDDFSKYRGATLVTPNVAELELAARARASTRDQVVLAGRHLQTSLELAGVLVTRGAAGMILLESDGEVYDAPAITRTIFDVTGAGDTVVGALALGMAAGIPPRRLLSIANSAASIAIGKLGAVAVSAGELLEEIARS